MHHDGSEISAWLEPRDDLASRMEPSVTGALKAAGVALRPRDAGSDEIPGILLFGHVTPALLDHISEASRGGVGRLLLLAVSRSCLTGDQAWSLLGAGASDLLAWDELPDPAATMAARLERWHAVNGMLNSALVQTRVVGSSPSWIALLRQVIEIAGFTDASVLLTGETGTGKELIARLIHDLDPRPSKRDFVVLDCASIVPELSGAEFFGHERGAFTGAVSQRDGVFALADGGTLFLDEIGELPPALQAQLLRVLQERTYKRVGSNTWQRSRFRLVCATNRDLQGATSRGEFRADLFFRIATFTVRLLALRDRLDDIPRLARHFLGQLLPGDQTPEFDPAVTAYLLQRDYPGNVRDLRQTVTRICAQHVGPGPITIGNIPPEERPAAGPPLPWWLDARFESVIRRALASGAVLPHIRRAVGEMAVKIALGDENGSLKKAALRLGVSDRALQMRRASAHHAPRTAPLKSSSE